MKNGRTRFTEQHRDRQGKERTENMSQINARMDLADGHSIPTIGFGCYDGYGDEMVQAVRTAAETGYRYFDSAERYRNEKEVGRGLAESGVRREDLYILSKIWPSSFGQTEETFDQTRRDLGTDYLDAYLIHWPGQDKPARLKTYEKMMDLRSAGKIRSLGVSNFLPEQMEEIKEEFGEYPVIHEMECHPSYGQRELIFRCRARKMQPIAYSPINRAVDLNSDTVRRLAEKYGRTPAQIVLRWHLEHSVIPIPKSVHGDRIRENFDVYHFELDVADIIAIDELEAGARAGKDPRTFPEA